MTVYGQLSEMLFTDCVNLRRHDPETASSLDALYRTVIRADIYDAGDRETLREKAEGDPKPTLFADDRLKELPARSMLIRMGEDRAALVVSDEMALECYIFRFSAEKNRWMWPFIGMRYEPKHVTQLAVLNCRTMAQLAPHAQSAIAREHAEDAALVIAALDDIREGRLVPLLHREHRKKTAAPTIRPSSFDQKGRRRHAKGKTGKGRHNG